MTFQTIKFHSIRTEYTKMENFDALSNNEIRDRLQKFGLPIIPVTNTTRKILIKRLNDVAAGGPKPTTNKARRETVNVVKHLSADESESDSDVRRPSSKPKVTATNRRATIAAAVPVTPVSIVLEKIPNPKPIAPVAAEKAPIPAAVIRKTGSTTPSKPKVIVPDITEQSDDDVVAVPVTNKPRKTSRSPSLGKSTVVTTSYKHTIEPLPEQSIVNDDDNNILLNDEDSDPGVDNFFANKANDSLNKFSTFRTTSIPENSASRRTTLDPFRSSVAHGPTLLNEYRDQANEVIATNDSLFRRRYTTNTPGTTLNGGSGGGSSGGGGGGDAEVVDPLKTVETPFLSNFTRRLAQLKADPLANLSDVFEYGGRSSTSSPVAAATATSPLSNYRQEHDYYRPSYAARPSLGRSQYARSAIAVAEPEPTAWKHLERKIRWPLFILSGLFLCVFIYVFLFTN